MLNYLLYVVSKSICSLKSTYKSLFEFDGLLKLAKFVEEEKVTDLRLSFLNSGMTFILYKITFFFLMFVKFHCVPHLLCPWTARKSVFSYSYLILVTFHLDVCLL